LIWELARQSNKRKLIKRFFKIVKYAVLIFILLLVACFLLVQTSPVRKWLAQRAASYLSDELNTEIRIDKVDLDLFTRINLENVYLEDQQGDTLAQFDRLSVDGIKFNSEKMIVRARDLLLTEPNFYIKIRNGDTLTNVQFLSDYFKTSGSDSSSNQWRVNFDNIELSDGSFRYENFNKSRDTAGMDYNYLDVQNINLSAVDFAIAGDSIKAKIERMQAAESSGFDLDSLSGDFIIDPEHAYITDAALKTNRSAIIGQIGFDYPTYRSWNNFVSEVEMNHDFQQSTLEMADLAFFAPELQGLQKELEIDGRFKGLVKNLKGRDLNIRFDKSGFFKGDVTLNGLPDFNQTFITLRIKNLTADKAALDRIPLPPFNKNKTVKTPLNFYRLGQMNFEGNFTGFVKDFVAYGTLNTAIGSVSSDLSLKKTEQGDYSYSGNLSTDKFVLGKFYKDTLLGSLTSSLSVEGRGLKLETVKADIDGEIDQFYFNGYDYKNINVKGTFKENFFDGHLKIDDKDLVMDFNGGVDFSKETPSFNFRSDVRHLDLVKLNFLKDYPYGTVAAELSMSGTGDNLDNFIGALEVENMSYCTLTEDYFFDNIQFEAESVRGRRRISLDSPIASVKITGQFDFENLENSFRNILANVIPAYEYSDVRKEKTQHFESTLRIEDWSPIQEVFLPKVHIADGTFMRLEVDEPGNSFHGVLASDSLFFYGVHMHETVFDLSNYEQAVYLTLGTEEVHYNDSYALHNLSLDARSENDTLYTDLIWNNERDSTSADIKGRFKIVDNDQFDFFFGRSSLTVQGKKWDLNDSAAVYIDSSSVKVDGFRLSHQNEFIAINGTASESSEDMLKAELQDFDLSFFSRFLKEEDLTLSGRVDGTAGLEDIYHEKLFTSDLLVSKFEVNEYKIGDISVRSSWLEQQKQLKIGGFISRNDITPLSFDGHYKPLVKESPLDLDFTFDAFKIDFVNAFIDEGISDLNGKLNGKVNVTGTPSEPLLKGGLKFDNTSVRIDYLNTTYRIEDEAGIYPDMFTMDNIVVRDEEGNAGRLTGTVIHNNFKRWNFDVTVNMENEPFLCMNTTEEMNELYYGTAYATGYLNVSGYADNLIFDINARSEKGTDISMPVGSSGEVEFEDFISFVDHSADSLGYEEELDLSGISLNFELDITPEAKFKLIFDEVAGDILEGTGEGHLNLEINNFGDFSMFGTIEVQGGSYLFTLKNLINKEFSIVPGGTISWYGDPFAADLNLKTVYKLTASLYDLMGGNAEQYSQRVPVNLIMELEGKLLNPAIAFDIELPSADQITRTRVQSAISTDQERNR